jgi:vacuolar-type H+-ATPase subunit I/STV1
MPKQRVVPPLPSQANALRARIYHLEQRRASSYPDERAALAEQIEEAIAEYEALVPDIEAEAEKLRDEINRGFRELQQKREDLLRLLGRKHQDTFHRNMVGETWPPPDPAPHFYKALELPLAELEHYEPDVWDQRVRNEREGKGYVTDAHLEVQGTPAEHGHGARIERFPNLGGDR